MIDKRLPMWRWLIGMAIGCVGVAAGCAPPDDPAPWSPACTTDNDCGDCESCTGMPARCVSNCEPGEFCEAGACVVGCQSAADCDDRDPCTDDACNESHDCVNSPNTASCDDDDPCTHSDTCSEGVCAGTTVVCTNGLVCCPRGWVCQEGTCVECYYSENCDDGNECTLGSCTIDFECEYFDIGGSCDDNDPCTEFDRCSEGVCSGSVVVCPEGQRCEEGECIEEPPAVECEEDADCDDEEVCQEGVCIE